MALDLNSSTFKKEVLDSEIPVLVDFWASWCGPCRSQAPIIEDFAKESNGKYKVCKINVDENEQISSQYGIRNIPTLLVFSGGEVVNKAVGLQNIANLRNLVNNL